MEHTGGDGMKRMAGLNVSELWWAKPGHSIWWTGGEWGRGALQRLCTEMTANS